MNNKTKEKRLNIISKISEIVNGLDHKNLDYLENYVENIFFNQLQRFIHKSETKARNIITCNTLSDKYVNDYCSMCCFNPTTGIYFKQDNIQFTYANEDTITYDILMTLQKLYPTISTANKINIKRNVLRRIKNNSYEDIIPESNSIQHIIKYLTPIIFESREQSKYFLTFIGDLILRKNKNQNMKCFIVNCDTNFRTFLYQLNKYINLFIYNMNIFNNIKVRFYHHDTKNANILYLNNNLDYSYFNKDTSFYITFIFICIYHSNKYESSIRYLEQYSDSESIEYITSLHTLNKEALLQNFWNDSIFEKKNSCMKENTILFIWKKYLKTQKLPIYLIYHQNIVDLFNNIYEKQTKQKCQDSIYHNISSFEIPEIENFLKFWEDSISNDDHEKYLEVEEIQYFLKQYLKEHGLSLHSKYFSHQQNILDIIQHYFPDIKCQDSKYIHGLRLKMWDKRNEVIQYKEVVGFSSDKLDKIYNQYCKHKRKNSEKDTIVSKIYFYETYRSLS